jgi:hypothetical protein
MGYLHVILRQLISLRQFYKSKEKRELFCV